MTLSITIKNSTLSTMKNMTLSITITLGITIKNRTLSITMKN